MTYYLLPRANLHTYKYLHYTELTDDEDEQALPPIAMSYSIAQYLYGMKEKIDDNDKKWDTFKKYTNPCEYIHSTIPFKKKRVAKIKPISRSYFKMVEMLHIFPVLRDQSNTEPIRTFHLAEAPGGFIEAIGRMRKSKNEDVSKHDRYTGMTLLDDTNASIPIWKKGDFMFDFADNILLENGADGTGNILSLANFEHVCSPHSNNGYVGNMDVVTADGGFDFSTDFNQQEIAIGKLLFAQIAYAVCMQKQGGSFILKIFDCFMAHTIDLLYLLSSLYEKVYFVKPQTSRYANSEKYVVCIGFLPSAKSIYSYFHECFRKMVQHPDRHMLRFLNVAPNFLFIQKIEEYNAIYAQKQMMNIQYTISLMECKNKHDKIESLIQTNVQKSTNWCIKYGVPYHTIVFPMMPNMFSLHRSEKQGIQ